MRKKHLRDEIAYLESCLRQAREDGWKAEALRQRAVGELAGYRAAARDGLRMPAIVDAAQNGREFPSR